MYTLSDQLENYTSKVVGDRGVRIPRLPYPYLPPPVPFFPASPASFTRNILYYITQTKDKLRRVNERWIFARAFVSFVYFDAICKSNNMIMLNYYLLYFFSTFYQRGLPLSAPWRLPPPTLSSPTSRNLSPGLPPHCLPPPKGWHIPVPLV